MADPRWRMVPVLFLVINDFVMTQLLSVRDNLDKTRQDNILFGVLYNRMYIDFIQII